MVFSRIVTSFLFGFYLIAAMHAQTPPPTPSPTPTMSCNYNFHTTVTASTQTMFVGETVTIDVNFYDDTGECYFALYEFTLYQNPAGDPFFSPASFYDGPGAKSHYHLTFTAIRPGEVRLFGTYYGELYQGWWQWTYSSGRTSWITILESPTPEPTSTVPVPPTPTPAATATPECPETSISCEFNQSYYHSGDEFQCLVTACNGDDDPLAVDIYIVLEIASSYFFWPSWSTNLDHGYHVIPECSCMTLLSMSFQWPEEPATFSAQMYCALLYAGSLDLIDLAVCSFASF